MIAAHTSISELLLLVKRANRAIKPAQTRALQFFKRAIIREKVDILVFESPITSALPNMWLEGEECHVPQLLKVIALDKLPVAALVLDAMSNVPLEIEVLEACARDLSICAAEKLVKSHVWSHKRAEKCVQRRFGRQAVDKFLRTWSFREAAMLDAEAPRAVAPNGSA
jgi:hypothetical protein